MSSFAKLSGRTTFIVGNKKNSGKTTFLNSALERLRKRGRVAYLSIGVDGEVSDQIFGFPKPRVYAESGDHVVTLETALEYTQAKFKVLKTFPYNTVLGRPKLVQVTSPGFVEIIGPENNAQLARILAFLHKEMRIGTILVDGAINRITQVSSFPDAQFVFILRVDGHRVESAVDELKRMFVLSKVKSSLRKQGPRVSKRDLRVRGDDMLYLHGALTQARANALDPKAKKIVVDDFTKVFLDFKELERFQRKRVLHYLSDFKLSFAVINLFGVERDEFLRVLSDPQLAKKLVFNEIGVK